MNVRRKVLALALAAGFGSLGCSGASAQGVQLFAILLGGNEPAGGDSTAFGTASVIFGESGQICFSILVFGIGKPNAAHIHEGVAGENGDPVITLPHPTTGNPGASSGCISAISPTLLASIRNKPSKFYINVHNVPFPGGAVRGQLF